jgi:hypothetical protein
MAGFQLGVLWSIATVTRKLSVSLLCVFVPCVRTIGWKSRRVVGSPDRRGRNISQSELPVDRNFLH